MLGKRMINFMAGLLFIGIFCLSSGAFGSLPYNDAGLSSEKEAGYAPVPSEVVFIDPSVPEMEKIVAQLPKGAEVVRLSPGMDGVAQISAHLAGKVALSAIRIISHGDAGYFVLNGKRVDGDFLRNRGDSVISWGRALAENGDILLYACNLAATDEGKAFVERFVDLTGADVAASTDVTGGEAFNGNWNLEYSIGQIDRIAITVDPNIGIKLLSTWTGGGGNSAWNNHYNWDTSTVPVSGDIKIPLTEVNPEFTGSGSYASLTIYDYTTLTVSSGTFSVSGTSDINGTLSISTGTFDANGVFDATGGVVTFTGAGNLNLASTVTSLGTFTKDTGTVTYDGGDQDVAAVDYYGIVFGGTGTKTAASSLTATTLSAPAAAYSVALNGGCTITNSCIFLNTGTTTIGNDAGDSSTFTGGLVATAGPVSIAGTITVSNGDKEMRLGTTTVSDDSTLDPPPSEGVGTTLIYLEAVTINDAKTLMAGDGNNTAISFGSTINSASGGTGNLTINNSATFSNHVGGTAAIGTLTLTAGNVTAGTSNIKAGTIAVNGGIFGQPESPSGTWDVDNVTIASGATMNATTGSFNVSGNWTNNGTFNHKNGTVTLDGTNQALLSGSTTFYNLTKNVTSVATLTFPSATRTTVENALDLSGASGQLLSLKSSTLGTQWEIDPQGTRTIEYLDVQYSNNISTAINTDGKNIVDSGNNTNWTFEAPTVTTQAVSAIGTTSATGNGTITSLGATNPTAHGVCWNTSGTPKISDNVKDNGGVSATGGFTASITGLSPGTTYHVRAFATNNVSTSYGAADLTFTTAHTVAAGTYYVNISTGSDSNDGSSANPWKTFHHAISQINDGAAGTYEDPYILIMAAGTYKVDNGEADTAITLSQSYVTILGADDYTIGASNTTTLIDGTSAADWTKAIKITGSYVTIKGLSITKFLAAGGYGIEISGGTENEVRNCKIFNNDTGIEITSSSAFKIRNCEIYENTTDGLNVISSTDGEIYHNTIYKHQGTGDDGVAVFNCSPAIKRNKIYDNNTGIRVEANASGASASPDIGNNVIYGTTDYFMAYGILITTGSAGGVANPTIYHNSIDGGSGDGIAIEWVASEYSTTLAPVIKYNIITRCDAYGIDAGVTGYTIDYNDVWNNTAGNYNGCAAGANDISQNPKTGSAGPLASDSPCIDAIPTTDPPGDDTTMDYLGYKRPKDSGYDMGAYEYIATQTYPNILPGGTGIETDYRIFTIPLDIGTGKKMQETMETALGREYDPPTHWRVYARTTSGDIEMGTSAFKSLDIKPGMGFWGITILTDTINFTGTLSPDAIYHKIKLAPGWNLFAVPWPSTSINLGKIYVTDNVNEYAITNAANTLTQQKIWDYTGTGPSSGYEIRDSETFALISGTGYFIKVPGSSNIILSIPPNNSSTPPNNNSDSFSPAMSYDSPESVGLPDDPEPPPLPGGSYGPVPDIKVNGKSGPVTVSGETPVSITVSLDPGNQAGENADWWVVAHTPFAAPLDWYSYVHPEGWQPGIYPCLQTQLFQVPPSFEVLNMALPAGNYTFYFAVDGNMDGEPDSTWQDTVEVNVE